MTNRKCSTASQRLSTMKEINICLNLEKIHMINSIGIARAIKIGRAFLTFGEDEAKEKKRKKKKKTNLNF
jgi:hypothetical protein